MLVSKTLKAWRENYYVSEVLAALTKPAHIACRKLAAQLEQKVKKNGVAIRLPNGRTMRIARDSGVDLGSLVFWNGLDGFEPQTSRTLRFFFERAATFVDVGANYGFYSILAGLWNNKLRVVAFEPVPQIYEALVRNMALNQLVDQVSPHPIALSNRTGTATFYLPETGRKDCESTGTLVPDGWQARKHSPTIEVETTLFDDFEKTNSMRVDLVKIDVEDAEADVLTGMEQTITRDRPFIVCEILERQHGNEKTRAVLEALGYTPYWITSSGYIRVSRFDFPRTGSQDFLLSPVNLKGEVISDLEPFWTARHTRNFNL